MLYLEIIFEYSVRWGTTVFLTTKPASFINSIYWIFHLSSLIWDTSISIFYVDCKHLRKAALIISLMMEERWHISTSSDIFLDINALFPTECPEDILKFNISLTKLTLFVFLYFWPQETSFKCLADSQLPMTVLPSLFIPSSFPIPQQLLSLDHEDISPELLQQLLKCLLLLIHLLHWFLNNELLFRIVHSK